jgi:hypothetical protein
MSDSKAVADLIRAELGRATAECLRLQARLEALNAEPNDRHASDEREHLQTLLARTEERRRHLEALAAGLPPGL